MSKEVLQIIKNTMHSLGLQYDFGEYKGNAEGQIVYPYFVGEYMETESTTEDGLQETTFILTGFSREDWDTLEEAKEKIEKHFSRSRVGITSNGTGVAIFYAHSLIVPTGDAELKSIQINLSIKEWKVI
jgi:hypothetical protein